MRVWFLKRFAGAVEVIENVEMNQYHNGFEKYVTRSFLGLLVM